jgi:hypothetical protein
VAIRYYFDECVDETIATALAAVGIDVLTVSAAGRKGLSDKENLDFASRENRVVYTVDDDFLVLAADYQARSEFFAGIAYHEHQARSRREIIDALILCDGVYEPIDMHNRVEFL